MGVEFSKDVERRRLETTWEFQKTPSVVQAARIARDMGWAENKVQVRFSKEDGLYYVEPYESGCGCKGILRYVDFFGAPDI